MPLQALQGAKCCKGGIQNETDPKRVRSTIMNRSFLNMHAVTETTEMCGKGATLSEKWPPRKATEVTLAWSSKEQRVKEQINTKHNHGKIDDRVDLVCKDLTAIMAFLEWTSVHHIRRCYGDQPSPTHHRSTYSRLSFFQEV